MPFDKFIDIDNINEARRKAVAKSIRTISVEELKEIGEQVFHDADEAWRHTFFGLITENPGATFHHAVTAEGAIFLYYRDKDKGLWYLPGSGKGPLGANGRQMMKEAIEGRQ
jgi:hypothetical protein